PAPTSNFTIPWRGGDGAPAQKLTRKIAHAVWPRRTNLMACIRTSGTRSPSRNSPTLRHLLEAADHIRSDAAFLPLNLLKNALTLCRVCSRHTTPASVTQF